jgi:hypothetical protein
VRDNNPGNLELNPADPWMGLAREQTDAPYCIFIDATWGFRALAIDLRNSCAAGRDTITKLITRFAPPPENKTGAYIADVSQRTGIAADAELDLSNAETLRSLCRAIAIHEAGGWKFSDDDLAQGISLALEPPAKLV